MNQIRGSQSISFGEAPYLISSACVAGSKEAEGPLGKLFDMVNQDDLFGAKTWEEAESTMQKEACVLALGKAHVDRHFHGGGRITDSHVRIVRSLFYIRRSTCSFCYERGSRVWGIYAGSDFQSLWKRGKGISVSAGVCVPASLICQLDGDGKRRISGRQTEKPCEDHRRDGWENCGLWTEGFPEYGGVYGAGSGRYHFNKSEGLRKKSDQL